MTSQSWNAEEYAKHASFVAELTDDVLRLLNPKSMEKILDLGCGDGRLTRRLKESECEVLGVDGSMAMVKQAATLGVPALVMDGHELTFEEEFDAVFSNAALHWMTRPEKVVNGVHRALKPRGRFVAEFGGAGNTNKIMTVIKKKMKHLGQKDFQLPWYFPTTDEYGALLEDNGFKVDKIELVERPTPLDSGMSKWLELFTAGITKMLSENDRKHFLKDVLQELKPVLYDEEKGWWADYVRLRVRAIKN